MSMKRLASLVEATPVISDVFQQYWSFGRIANAHACRGIYQTYEQAHEAALKFAPVGYNEALLFLACAPFDPRSNAARLDRRDYPILLWLSQSWSTGVSVFNLGGSVGREYFAYRQLITFPQDLKWIVCDLPHAVSAGQQLLAKQEAPGLEFTTSLERASGADILLTCGTLQYLKQDLGAWLRQLRQPPRRLPIIRVPLYDGDTFFTVQHLEQIPFNLAHILRQRSS